MRNTSFPSAVVALLFSVCLCPSVLLAQGTEYFQTSYETSRENFLKNLSHLPKTSDHQAIPVPSKSAQNLFIDTVYIPASSGKKERLLILTSGVHGIEGSVGSALQTAAVAEDFWGLRDPDLSILLVHAINPYGFKFERRVTEANVDLNRNLDVDTKLFSVQNEGYRKIRDLFNPTAPATTGFWSRLSFYGHALHAIYQHSMASLRAAVLRGQYEFPESIFFGGQHFEPQKDLLESLLLKHGAGFSQILLVDLHTGYGARGVLHLFADKSPEMDGEYLQKIFAGKTLDYGQQKDFYQVTGSFVSFAAKLYAGKEFAGKVKFAPMVFEFGTLDSQKTLGSVDSIYRMTVENQLYQHKAQTDEDRAKIRELFREMFYPSSPEWRQSALVQFKDSLAVALKNQKALSGK